ncbi:transcription factor MYC1-like [Phragmites australis]|uniref:transcription factor MYC1-like n=1 Tax=Phragmites australis TaxID=29695 RepID=UPI002D775889|nr:transcription factor MYC1-like [Phragmites australis]
MDELLSPPSPASFFSHAGHPVIEFASCEVPEQWLLGDFVAKNEGYGDGEELWPVRSSFSPDSELSEQPPPPPPLQKQDEAGVTVPPQRPGKRRGRKPGPRPDGPTVSHVESERQRREKLNRRFCDLRAAVPTVSRMDKASLLADAAAYIAELRDRIARLEAESRRAAAAWWEPVAAASCGAAPGVVDEAVEVRMVGLDAAAVRATSASPHAPARLMCALRALDLHIQHACVSRVHGMTVQDVVVDVPAALQDGGGLRSSLLQMLQDSKGASLPVQDSNPGFTPY